MDFSKIFHLYSKDHTQRGEVNPGLERELWPESWNTIYYKSYPSSKKIILPKIDSSNIHNNDDIFELISKRKSKREYSDNPITIDELSILLKYSCGVMEDSDNHYSRAQPSAGGRYPIELYVYIHKPSGKLPSGVYHYNVKDHALDVLSQNTITKEFLAENFTYEWVQDSSMCIIFTGAFDRTKMKYGERGYRYTLLEAGHIAQNMYLVCENLNIRCTGLGGTKDSNIEKHLKIDGVNEAVVYAMSFGK